MNSAIEKEIQRGIGRVNANRWREILQTLRSGEREREKSKKLIGKEKKTV